jgi:hypothetical protein
LRAGSPGMQHINAASCQQGSVEGLRSSSAGCLGLQRIDLPCCDAGFRPLRAGSPGMQHFNAASCQQGSVKGLGTSSAGCPGLQRIDFPCCDAGRRPLYTGSPGMQHINAASCQQGRVEGPGTSSAVSEKVAADGPLGGQDECLQHGFDEGNSVKAPNSFSVVEVAVAADVPLCGSCAGAHAEFVCSECELRELLGQMSELAYSSASGPVRQSRRRWFAQIQQMLSAGLEERVHNEGSPTLLATLSEIQLCLLA